jgi:DNA-binding transcriptional regulator LsrR (DeoR family)
MDDAARAAWLYYIAGKTQDEIAAELGVSRQSAQRLVSQAMAAGLVKVRIDHPISNCLSLGKRMREGLGLAMCEVVPTLSGSDSALGLAQALADYLEKTLSRPEPLVIGLGTGRTLRGAVEAMARMECAQHKIVSMTGNISPDGSTAYYNVLFTMSDKITASTYPMPMPVIAATMDERDALLSQKTVAATRALAARADIHVFGIGEMGLRAPLVLDGFLSAQDLAAVNEQGAVGEILGWIFDADGALIAGGTNARVTSTPLAGHADAVRPANTQPAMSVAAAKGPTKVKAILGAVKGGWITGLITDEATAEAVLAAL